MTLIFLKHVLLSRLTYLPWVLITNTTQEQDSESFYRNRMMSSSSSTVLLRRFSSVASKPWTTRMSDDRFNLLKRVIDSPSPVNLEGAMTFGVIEPFMKSLNQTWKYHRFLGSASLVVDSWTKSTKPDLTIMVVGHADKIRMQVRHIEKSSGKIYIDSDSFLPIALLGNQVTIFSEKPDELGSFIKVKGTVEALGAIHFGDAGHRSGAKGVGPDMLYVDLGCYGPGAADRVSKLGIKPGDAVLMDSPLRRAVGDDVFQGAYLDNGVGSFVVTDSARILSKEEEYVKALDNVRVLFAIAAHEEIGRFGSRVLANKFAPDVLIAIDVNHDYVNAPGVGAKRYPPLEMGKGYTISVGAVASRKLNEVMQQASKRKNIPVQLDCVGRDTGTDAMAAVLGSVDCAVGSIGVPTRNMHTSSEAASTKDLDACLYGLAETILLMSEQKIQRDDFLHSHVDLSKATLVESLPPADPKKKKENPDEDAESVA